MLQTCSTHLFEKFTFFCSLEHVSSSAYLSRTCRRLLANTDPEYSAGQRASSGRSAVRLLFIYSWQNENHLVTFIHSALIHHSESSAQNQRGCDLDSNWARRHILSWSEIRAPWLFLIYQRQVKAESERRLNISECTGLGYRELFPSVRFFKGLRQVTLLYSSSAEQRQTPDLCSRSHNKWRCLLKVKLEAHANKLTDRWLDKSCFSIKGSRSSLTTYEVFQQLKMPPSYPDTAEQRIKTEITEGRV